MALGESEETGQLQWGLLDVEVQVCHPVWSPTSVSISETRCAQVTPQGWGVREGCGAECGCVALEGAEMLKVQMGVLCVCWGRVLGWHSAVVSFLEQGGGRRGRAWPVGTGMVGPDLPASVTHGEAEPPGP